WITGQLRCGSPSSSIRRASRSSVGTTFESGHRSCNSAMTCAYSVLEESKVVSIPGRSRHRQVPAPACQRAPRRSSLPVRRRSHAQVPGARPGTGRAPRYREYARRGRGAGAAPDEAMGEPDQAYFREWDARAPGERRCLARARALLHAAGLDAPGPPVLTVVGSKGKGTAAVYASAYLCAAGQRVVTLTSPSLGPTTARIRVGGV